MNLFIKLYIKMINHFWKLILLKFIKVIVFFIVETTDNIFSLSLYLSDDEGTLVLVFTMFVAISMVLIGYSYTILSDKLDNREHLLNNTILPKNDNDNITITDLDSEILTDILFLFWGISLFILSTSTLCVSANNYNELKKLQFTKACNEINQIFL